MTILLKKFLIQNRAVLIVLSNESMSIYQKFVLKRTYCGDQLAFRDKASGSTEGFIEKQAEDPSSLWEGMNAVRFPINYYFRAALISYIFSTIHR